MTMRGKHTLLTHWIAERKKAERELEVAERDFQLWFKRAKIALEKGEVELASAAKNRAGEARTAMGEAQVRLNEVAREIERVKSEQGPDFEAAERAERVAHTAAQFEALGIEPKFAVLDGIPVVDLEEAPAATPEVDVWDEADAFLDLPFEDDEG